ncbi:hypothetical protein [Clostridium paraputrificum]|uniref:Uncharacterized protein n=1 Tax=Clostridium paraputrificum TaxID=29363 RepID=A0A6N3ESC2_9CLOT
MDIKQSKSFADITREDGRLAISPYIDIEDYLLGDLILVLSPKTKQPIMYTVSETVSLYICYSIKKHRNEIVLRLVQEKDIDKIRYAGELDIADGLAEHIKVRLTDVGDTFTFALCNSEHIVKFANSGDYYDQGVWTHCPYCKSEAVDLFSNFNYCPNCSKPVKFQALDFKFDWSE